eukprot:CFRG1160T1
MWITSCCRRIFGVVSAYTPSTTASPSCLLTVTRGNKTHKAMAKRFKVLGNGTFKRLRSGKTHLNTKMSGEETRLSRRSVYATDTQNKMLRKAMPHV